MARPFEHIYSTSAANLAWNSGGDPTSIKYENTSDRGNRLGKINSHGALTRASRGRSASETTTVAMPPKIKIKPLLRKMSNDQQTVDLSKSVAENEALGISTSCHTRNTSNTSTLTTTSHSYIHPMRQTPRPAHSFANSVESGSSGGPALPYDLQDSIQYATRRLPPPLQIPRHNISQTNIPGTPSSLRNTSAMSTRTSLDSIFRRRSRANTNEDPVARAAQVAVLRREFAERERQKEEVRREQENRRVERETKKQQKRDESQQRKSETRARKATSEKENTLEQRRRSTKATKSQWQLFVFWFKTMLLKMRNGMSRQSH